MVTGATGGIGTAVTGALVERGYRVLAVGRSGDRLAALGSGRPLVVPLAIDYNEALPELSLPDRLDAVVHCAGIAPIASVEDSADSLWREVFNVNVTAVAVLTRALLPSLRAANGHVVLINMAAGARAVPDWSAYVASKAALREFADSLREEESAHGVRVTTVYPSGTATGLLRKVRHGFGRAYEPDQCISPETLASLVVAALQTPPDAYVTEFSVRPAPNAP
jgi:NADP-dependent 3-hydroxy acid dehydrogenase YdfG